MGWPWAGQGLLELGKSVTGRLLAEGHSQRHSLAVADHHQRLDPSDRALFDEELELLRVAHRFAAKLDVDVPGLHPCTDCRRVVDELADHDALAGGDAHLFRHVGSHRENHDTQVGAADLAVGDQFLAGPFCRGTRDGKADADVAWGMASAFAAAVDLMAVLIPMTLPSRFYQRPAAVSGVDGRVGLKQVLKEHFIGKGGAGQAATCVLTMPAVTVPSSPNGSPKASTHLPTCMLSLSPSFAAATGPAPLRQMIASSVRSSRRMLFCLEFPTVLSLTVILPGFSTTWLAVKITPDGSIMTRWTPPSPAGKRVSRVGHHRLARRARWPRRP